MKPYMIVCKRYSLQFLNQSAAVKNRMLFWLMNWSETPNRLRGGGHQVPLFWSGKECSIGVFP